MWCSASKGPEDHGHPVWFSGLDPYAQRLFQILWIFGWYYALRDDNFKLFAIFLWENSFLILLHYFSPQHWRNGDPLPIFWETLPLWEALFIPNHVANWPNKCWNWSSSCSLYVHLTFPASYATCPNFFGMCSSQESKMSQYLAWHFKCLTFNIWYVIYILLWIKYKFMRFVNYCIPFLFTICTVSQLFWNWVCIKIHFPVFQLWGVLVSD